PAIARVDRAHARGRRSPVPRPACTTAAPSSTNVAPRQVADPRVVAHRTDRRRELPHFFRRQQPRADLERTPRDAAEGTPQQNPAYRDAQEEIARPLIFASN